MKKFAICTIIIFIVSAIAGAVCRTTFTKHDDMKYFNVATINGEFVSRLSEEYISEVQESQYILKVKCVSDVLFSFVRTYQQVQVEKVFVGEDISVGDNINISTYSSYIFYDDMSINMGFVNAMNKDEEYLVFLNGKQKSVEYGDEIYTLTEVIISPVFSYSDHTNVISEQASEDSPYVSYTSVQNNEFFTNSEDGLDRINEIKKILIDKYKS